MTVIRGCGTRVVGGVYAELPVGSRGTPIGSFLVCPPVPVDPERLRLTPRGVTLHTDRDGATHIFDWVGREHYPNLADLIVELKRHGISRRLPRTLDFARLDARSRLILLHERAIVTEPAAYRRVVADEIRRASETKRHAPADCPAGKGQHVTVGNLMCLGLAYDDLEDGEPVLDPRLPWRLVERTVGDTVYRAYRRPEGLDPDYRLGIVGRFPIARLVVIRDPHGTAHEEPLAAAQQARLPVSEEER